MYVDFTSLEHALYEAATSRLTTAYECLRRDYPALESASGRTIARLRSLYMTDRRARQLETLASERTRLVNNTSRKREALIDVLNTIDVVRSRVVVVHDSPGAAEQTLIGLRSRWIDAAIVRASMPMGAADEVMSAFAGGRLNVLVIAGDPYALEVPAADVAIITTSGSTREERRHVADLSGTAALSISILVRGTVDETRGSLDHELVATRRVTHHRWHQPGDALVALDEPGSYEPEDKDLAVDRLIEGLSSALKLEQYVPSDPLVCRSCLKENPETRTRCSACYGRLSRRSDLAIQRSGG